jgi:hypothetical protein
MAQAFDKGQGDLTPEAKRYYGEAVKTYERILKDGKEKSGWIQPPQMETQVLMRMAETLRKLRDFKATVKMLEEILRDNNMMLNVQIEAAKTLQAMGDDPKQNPDYYMAAMRGFRKDDRKEIAGQPNKNFDKNIIWGWGKLSQLTAGNPSFKDAFYEARYSLAECRYKYAMRQNDKAEQTKLLGEAKRDIVVTARLYKSLGGEKWEPKFDALLKNVQGRLGEDKVGLAAIREPETSSSGPGE